MPKQSSAMPCLRLRLDLLLERLGVHVAEVGRAVGEQHDAVDAVGQVMAQRGW